MIFPMNAGLTLGKTEQPALPFVRESLPSCQVKLCIASTGTYSSKPPTISFPNLLTQFHNFFFEVRLPSRTGCTHHHSSRIFGHASPKFTKNLCAQSFKNRRRVSVVKRACTCTHIRSRHKQEKPVQQAKIRIKAKGASER